ncbi:nuclease-related domain-containing protein [Bacillus benzoevorans]|uniref:NERD domain-containing protein n=1 Tax=Bacillus benzoevorans TaxID=1456 RepID=A0A7X0HNT8_9BACI|nr:nuclease-related domain-containing protein [Bacillus benzoevorans]MBB6444016.1 hypothetical protein [Bacillus benzoevorans]
MKLWFLLSGIIIVFIYWQKRRSPQKITERFEDNNVTKLLNKLPENCIVLHDVYIPKKNGSSVRIDHIVINQNGLYVIETKNYNGVIKGSENSKYWTQIVADHPENFYNPILQNNQLIKELHYYLRDALHNIPVHSVIVFGKRSHLKLEKPIKKAQVIKRFKLSWVLQHESKDIFVYYKERKAIKDLLSSPYLEKSIKHRRNQYHLITDINQYKSRNKKSSM